MITILLIKLELLKNNIRSDIEREIEGFEFEISFIVAVYVVVYPSKSIVNLNSNYPREKFDKIHNASICKQFIMGIKEIK